jgi:hypothetical protein
MLTGVAEEIEAGQKLNEALQLAASANTDE